MLDEIYEAQRKLNERTVGFDVLRIEDEEERLRWFRNYLTAWDQELKELLESLDLDGVARGGTLAPGFELDVQNAKVEVVDMLHFLMSMLQVMGEPGIAQEKIPGRPESFEALLGGLVEAHGERHGIPIPAQPDAEQMNRLLTLHGLHAAVETGKLLDRVRWKWWAKQQNRWEEARGDLYQVLLPRWCLLVLSTGMGAGDVVDLYMKKNKLNFDRQQGGYKEGTYRKTGDDGREDNRKLFDE